MVVSRAFQANCVLAAILCASWTARALEQEVPDSIDWEGRVQLAQEARASARVYTEPKTVYAGRPFQLKLQASGRNIQFPSLPPIAGLTLDLRQRPSMSSQTSIVNGRARVRNEELGYRATAPRSGKVTIPALEFMIDGKPVRSAVLEFTVKDAPPPGGGRPVKEDYLFIRMVVDKEDVYQGEPVLLTLQVWMLDGWGASYRTYPRTPRSQPSTEGFYSAELESRETLGELNGYKYKVMEYPSLLYPTRTGELEIGPWHWEGYADVPTAQARSSFFRRAQRLEFELDTPPRAIAVRPLPDGPPGFKGAVGEYTLDAIFERATMLQGVPVDLYVTIRGQGNPDAVGEPSFDQPEWAYFSEPELSTETYTTPDGLVLGVSKRFKYTVTPLEVGEMELGPIVFTSFNPIREVYETARAGPYEVTVRKSAEGEQHLLVSSQLPGEERGVDILGRDIGPLMTRPPRLRAEESFAAAAPLGFALPVLLYAGVAVYAARRRRFSQDKGFARAYRAKSVAEAGLAVLKSSQDPSEALCGILTEFVRDMFDVEAAGLTSVDVERLLRENGVAPENRDNLLTILRTCERARYAAQELSREERSALIRGAEAAVVQLGGAIKKRGSA